MDDMEQNLARVVDVVIVKQRRMKGILNGLGDTAFACAIACTHDGHATIFQHSLHILKIKVDFTVHGDDFRDAACGIAEGVISLVEGVVK